ncbi:M48 family metalloprotease [Roseibium sp.]|uniref:M48 family metalloprotease n=1 Tax=Roseibium sp. TaxID=1936156 RepID=UPI003A9802E5
MRSNSTAHRSSGAAELALAAPLQRFGMLGKAWQTGLKKTFASLLSATLLVPFTLPLTGNEAQAQRGRIPLVRDAETEDLLKDYAAPIFKVAGIGNSPAEIILVNDKSFNAFVPDSRRMFINIGVILEAEDPGEVIGVIAHETGHIAGRHLVRLRQAAANAQIMSVIGMVLGAGAAVAGAASGSGQAAQAAGVAALGSPQLGQRSLLSYQRGEEASADRAALRYLNATKQSAKGMLTVFERFAEQQVFSARFADPYAVSHPMANERYRNLAVDAQKSAHYDKPTSAALKARHDMVRAKLLAFASHPNEVARKYPRSDTSMPAQYARAVAAMKARSRKAVDMIDALIRNQPSNPHFQELKGQAFMEMGRPKQAVQPFRRAVALHPNEGQFLIWLGYALVASNDNGALPEAERMLKAGLQRDPNSGIGYSQLAIAHARQGDTAQADVATAKGLMVQGDFDAAKRYAKRAQQNLKRGTPAWLQADDIVSYRPPQSLQRRR